MSTILINPADERRPVPDTPAARLDTLAGKTLALLDISKRGGNHFLDAVERILRDRYKVSNVVRETKPTFSKPAPEEVIQRLLAAKPSAIIEALAD
jgi:hypothetical protein